MLPGYRKMFPDKALEPVLRAFIFSLSQTDTYPDFQPFGNLLICMLLAVTASILLGLVTPSWSEYPSEK